MGTERPHLLVVDDEEVLLFLMQRALSSTFNVVIATDGASALRALKDPDNKIRMALIDITMPGMNGPELVERLRRDYPELPFAVMTALPEVTVRALLGGQMPGLYLQKPVSISIITSTLDRMLAPA